MNIKFYEIKEYYNDQAKFFFTEGMKIIFDSFQNIICIISYIF